MRAKPRREDPRRFVLPAVIVTGIVLVKYYAGQVQGHAALPAVRAAAVMAVVRDVLAVLLVLLAAVIVAMTARVVSPGRVVTRVCEEDDGELDLAPLEPSRLPRVLPPAPRERVPETARPERHLKAVK